MKSLEIEWAVADNYLVCSAIRGICSGPRSALLKDLGDRVAELFAVVRCERREEMTEFRIHLGMESGRCPPAGVGRRHPQGAPVTWHRRSLGKAASLDPVDQAGERGLLYAEAARQFGHSLGAGGQGA